MSQSPDFDTTPDSGPWGGPVYDPDRDRDRLATLLERVLYAMADGKWRTVEELAAKVGSKSITSVSARLRDLRKPKFGGYVVERRHIYRGLWEFRMPLSEAGRPVRMQDLVGAE